MDVDPMCDGGSMEVTPAEVILSDDNFEEPESVALSTEDPPKYTSGYQMESAGIEVIGIFRRV